MAVGAFDTAKELASGYQSLLLADLELSDGTFLRLSSHSVTYGGNAYLPRLANQELAAIQALSEQGIDIPASVTLRIADPDYYIWTNWEKLKGLKGAELTLRSVLYDVVATDFSITSRIIFRGVCREPGGKMPAHDGKLLSVGFASKLGLSDISLPLTRVQRTCPWDFPATAAQRQDGADNPYSPFRGCGYAQDATGGNARGNLVGGVVATSCNRTKEDCVARGMYTKDSSNRKTGRFGGIQWAGPQGQMVREYRSGKWSQVQGGANETRYGDVIPLLFGRAWTDPLILNYVPDGNFLKMEALICFGEVDYIHEVLVNDVRIPHTFDDTLFPGVPPGISNVSQAARGGWWKTTNKGGRDGSPTNDAGYNDTAGVPQGDPYGSYCVIEIVVPRALADAGSQPRVRILAERGTSNPVTQLQSILQDWCSWQTAELNTGRFGAEATFADASISYPDQFGNTASRKRFTSGFYIRQRESAAEIVRSLRNNARLLLLPDSTGLLAARIKRTLADQQSAPVSGSNYNTAVASKTSSGSAANGYVAYRFDTSNIIDGVQVSEISGGNRWSMTFQNADNRNSWDSFSPIDSEDIVRVGGREIPSSVAIRGVDNYDQAQRLVATIAAEQLRGNWRGDTGGTLAFEFTLSVRAAHLSLGDICQFNWPPLGVSDQLVRLVKIQPEANFERAKLTVTWHDDNWYVDTYGQSGQPRWQPAHRNRLLRPPFAWLPYRAQPPAGDSMFGASEWSFSLEPVYGLAADGSALARVFIKGRAPVNDTTAQPRPPFVPLTGSTANSGGSIGGGQTIYVAFAAKDAAGGLSELSAITATWVPSGTNLNTVTVASLMWDAGTAGYVIYAGTDANRLAAQVEASGTPSSVTLTSLAIATYGAPDGEFSFARVRARREWHSGVWGAQVAAVTATTIKIATAVPFTTNEWAGRDISLLGKRTTGGVVPIYSARVASNTTDTLTLAGGAPSPVAAGIAVGDVVTMRSIPTYGTDGIGSYVDDAKWVNAFAPSGMNVGEEVGRMLRVIAGTGAGQVVPIKGNTATRIYADFVTPLDSTSRYIVEESTWADSDTSPMSNSDPTAELMALADVANEVGQTWVFQVLLVDGGGDESSSLTSPVREVYLPGGGARARIQSVLSDYTVQPTDRLIEIDTSSGPITVTLPDAAEYAGQSYTFVLVAGTDPATINALGADLIDGSASYVLTYQYESVTFTSRG